MVHASTGPAHVHLGSVSVAGTSTVSQFALVSRGMTPPHRERYPPVCHPQENGWASTSSLHTIVETCCSLLVTGHDCPGLMMLIKSVLAFGCTPSMTTNAQGSAVGHTWDDPMSDTYKGDQG